MWNTEFFIPHIQLDVIQLKGVADGCSISKLVSKTTPDVKIWLRGFSLYGEQFGESGISLIYDTFPAILGNCLRVCLYGPFP